MFSSFSAALVGFGFYSLLAVLALAPTAAARFASIHFSAVSQCGNFTVNFAGGQAPAALPLTLTILPVNGTPIFIPLPSNAWNSTSQTGVAITFLPLPAGTEFVASLDDANGRGTALVSDVLVIENSDTDDRSCLARNPVPFVPHYTVNGALSQCQSFPVSYDQNVTSPTVRAFVPKGPSFPVPETEDNDALGADTYLMDVPRGSTVVLLFSDNDGHHETSAILPVLGDVGSDASCIPKNPLASAATLNTKSDDNSSSKQVTPKIAIIVIVVCVGVVSLVAAAMVVWYFLHRRKAQRARKFAKLDEAASPTPRDPEKQMVPASSTPGPLSPTEPGYGPYQQFVRDPPYIRMGSALITPTSPDPKDPFGERAAGSILGPLSARESLNSRLGATALGNTTNGSSMLALPRSQTGTLEDYDGLNYSPAGRSSAFDPASEQIPGTSPYIGGLTMTPDNSLASGSLLRQAAASRQSISSGSVSSVEIDRILEMATIYSTADMPELPLPQPAVTAPATFHSSAYMAGRQSRPASYVFSPGGTSPTHSRNGSAAPTLHGSTSYSTLRMQRAFRDPPLATLPSSPLPSPGMRPSFDFEVRPGSGVDVQSGQSFGLRMPPPPQVALGRSASAASRQSMYSENGEDDDVLDGFAMLRPPVRRS